MDNLRDLAQYIIDAIDDDTISVEEMVAEYEVAQGNAGDPVQWADGERAVLVHTIEEMIWG